VNCSRVFASLACALLVFALVGCGATDHLQSITLNVIAVNGAPVTAENGLVNLAGDGATLQLQAIGNYSNTKQVDISTKVTYNAYVDGAPNNVDVNGFELTPPCATGTCPNPTQPPPYATGTVEYSPTGLITAVEPAVCTWVDTAPVVTVGTAPTPAWAITGDYVVTATFEGIVSQPLYIPVASAAGNPSNPSLGSAGEDNNPDELCGPSSGGS